MFERPGAKMKLFDSFLTCVFLFLCGFTHADSTGIINPICHEEARLSTGDVSAKRRSFFCDNVVPLALKCYARRVQ